MKRNPMSPKFAAALLLVTTGTMLIVSPAQAADDTAPMPAPVVQTINKYELSSFQSPAFAVPEIASWAVAYTPAPKNAQLDPAEQALLTQDATLAQQQKTIIETQAAVVRVEQERLAAIKAAADKAAADKIAADKAAADKAAADEAAKASADKAAADKAATDAAAQAQEEARVTAAQANTTAQWNTVTAQSTSTSGTSDVPKAYTPTPATNKIGAALVASAYSQLGIHQDCTAMVERALRSIGKNAVAGSLAPLDFLRFGTVVTDPQPGDLMIRPGHVAIYVGNGMAISGGFNGGHTELHPASYLAGSVFVRVS